MSDSETYTVVHPDNPRRILFEGTFDSAKEWLEQNFPRPGGFNGEHQAHLVHPDGGTQTFTEGAGWNDKEGGTTVSEPNEPTPTDPIVDEPVADGPETPYVPGGMV